MLFLIQKMIYLNYDEKTELLLLNHLLLPISLDPLLYFPLKLFFPLMLEVLLMSFLIFIFSKYLIAVLSLSFKTSFFYLSASFSSTIYNCDNDDLLKSLFNFLLLCKVFSYSFWTSLSISFCFTISFCISSTILITSNLLLS